jgi:hypothetical protein
MATPHEPLPSAAPADPNADHPTADLNATAGGTAPPTAVPTGPPTGTDRYVLGDEIALGGMGVVYRAADTALGREVAVKVLLDKLGPGSGAARRFADEARITGQLQHPAIPPVHDLGSLPDGRPFLAMKLIKGNTLDALLKARTNPGEDRGRFVAVSEQVCQALEFAHAHGVIHRDLKPANVMVGSFGEVQVMDVETRLDVARSLGALGFVLLLTGDAAGALECLTAWSMVSHCGAGCLPATTTLT